MDAFEVPISRHEAGNELLAAAIGDLIESEWGWARNSLSDTQ